VASWLTEYYLPTARRPRDALFRVGGKVIPDSEQNALANSEGSSQAGAAIDSLS